MNKLFANAICTFIPNREKRGIVRYVLTDSWEPKWYIEKRISTYRCRRAVQKHTREAISRIVTSSHTTLFTEKTVYKIAPEVTLETAKLASSILCPRIKSVEIPKVKLAGEKGARFMYYALIPGSPPRTRP